MCGRRRQTAALARLPKLGGRKQGGLMRQWRTAIAVIATIALAATACSPGPQTGGTQPPAESPTPGGRVIVGSFSDIQRLNPATSNDATSSNVSAKIYDALI